MTPRTAARLQTITKRPPDRRAATPGGRRPWRPDRIEALEGRALLAASPIDPTFHGGQAVIIPGDPASTASQNSASAVAVQADGKIVVAGTVAVFNSPGTGATLPVLAVRRYNADGTLDATFGTGGEADIPCRPGRTTGSRWPATS